MDDNLRVDGEGLSITLPGLHFVCTDSQIIIVLNWVSIYWFPRQGPAASAHIYWERAHNLPPDIAQYVKVPFGILLFPKELGQPPLA
jgi:hypothetical protein